MSSGVVHLVWTDSMLAAPWWDAPTGAAVKPTSAQSQLIAEVGIAVNSMGFEDLPGRSRMQCFLFGEE